MQNASSKKSQKPSRENALTPLELQSRFGDKALKFQVICPQLSPKRDCSFKRVNPFRTAVPFWGQTT